MSAAWAVAVPLIVLGVLDALFAGFRASCGRTGLVRHGRLDRAGAARGAAIGAATLLPVCFAILADARSRPGAEQRYVAAGRWMLAAYLPYGVLVLATLAAYVVLGWRRRFLASAVLLGPLTLVRPLVAAAGAVAGGLAAHDALVAALALAAVVAVLLVEPLAGRRYRVVPETVL